MDIDTSWGSERTEGEVYIWVRVSTVGQMSTVSGSNCHTSLILTQIIPTDLSAGR